MMFALAPTHIVIRPKSKHGTSRASADLEQATRTLSQCAVGPAIAQHAARATARSPSREFDAAFDCVKAPTAQAWSLPIVFADMSKSPSGQERHNCNVYNEIGSYPLNAIASFMLAAELFTRREDRLARRGAALVMRACENPVGSRRSSRTLTGHGRAQRTMAALCPAPPTRESRTANLSSRTLTGQGHTMAALRTAPPKGGNRVAHVSNRSLTNQSCTRKSVEAHHTVRHTPRNTGTSSC